MLYRDIRNNRRTRLSEEAVDYREMVADAVEDCQANLDLIYWNVRRDVGTRIIISKKKLNNNNENLIKFAKHIGKDGEDYYICDVDDIKNGFDEIYFNVQPNSAFDYDGLKKDLAESLAALNELERIRKCIAKYF